MASSADNFRARIIACVTMLCESLPGKDKPTKLTFAAYEMGLDDLLIEAIEDATKRALKCCKFVPSVAELREMCGCLSTEQRTVKAWRVLNEALQKHDYYDTMLFDDPALQATVHNVGGWMSLSERWADGSAEEWDVWFRKEFEKVYAAFLSSGQWGEAGTTPLLGYFDKTNRGNGKPANADGTPCRDYFVEYKTGLPLLLPDQLKKQPPRLPQPLSSELVASIGRAVE